MDRKQPTNAEILEAIRKSGYLMEQEVATMLESLGFHVESNRAFEDLDESKSREIDVWAFKSLHRNEEHNFHVTIEILCECKNNSNPYIFLTRPKNEKDKKYPNPSEFLFPIQRYNQMFSRLPDGRPKSWREVPAFQYLNLAPQHYFYSQESKAVQFCKIVRNGSSWEANHGGVYDAIFYPLVKALLARQHEISGFHKTDAGRDLNFKDAKNISLFFPIVVLYGDILCLDSTNSEAEPISVPSVTFSRELRSKNINGMFTVDFINIGGLKNFIESKLNPFAQYVASLTESSPYVFMTRSVDKLIGEA